MPTTSKERVLILCTGNSARSQMAEGLLRHLAGDRYEVCSAGIHPVGLNPHAVEVMREIGIDISGHYSKDVSQFLDERFTCVITVCDQAREACPVLPFASQALHWNLDDPAAAQGSHEEKLQVFRRIRDEIEQHVSNFISQTA